MNTNDKKLVIKFLEDLSERFGNAGCNDYYLPNTPENFDLITRVAHWAFSDSPGDLKSQLPKLGDEKLLTMDWFVVDYFVHQLKLDLNEKVEKTKKAACILLIRYSDGRLVAASRRGEPNNIGLPGGKVDAGETVLEAGLREFFEETGIYVHPHEVAEVYVRPGTGETDYETTTFLCFTNTISAVVDFETPYEQEKDVVIRWVTWDELITHSNSFAKYNTGLYKHVRHMLP